MSANEQQPSTLPMTDDGNDGGESESELVDVAAIEGRGELTPKSESPHKDQLEDDDNSTTEQNDSDDSEG